MATKIKNLGVLLIFLPFVVILLSGPMLGNLWPIAMFVYGLGALAISAFIALILYVVRLFRNKSEET